MLTSDTEFGPTETGFKVFAGLHLYRLGLSEAGSREVVKLSNAPVKRTRIATQTSSCTGNSIL